MKFSFFKIGFFMLILLFNFALNLKIIDQEKQFKIRQYLRYHPQDIRQINMIANNKKDDFFLMNYFNGHQRSTNNYKYKSYLEILEHFQSLSIKYPQLVTIYTAQEKFHLPNPVGDCGGKKY
jgi:hypothetical protein